MACKEVKEYAAEYGKLADEIKNICTDRACTLDAIQKTIEEKGIKVSESALLTMISQITGMMTFSKHDTYDAGDIITYQKGKIFKSETIANLLVIVSYKKFYLYNLERYKDDAFKEHIRSKLDFETSGRETIRCTSDLENALGNLNISVEKWENYVFVSEFDAKVYCMKKAKDKNYVTKKYLGKFIRKN